MLAVMLGTGVTLVVLSLASSGSSSVRSTVTAPSAAFVDAKVSPGNGQRFTPFVVSIETADSTGRRGNTRRTYRASVQAVKPRAACVNNRDMMFPLRAVGATASVALRPAGGEGGHLGWCRGTFRGTVKYVVGFACPSVGTCQAPSAVKRKVETVARFTFEVL